MTEINYIHGQIVPAHPDFIAELSPDLYDRLNDYSVILKEGVRVILVSKLPDGDEIVESWLKLKEIKSEESNT